MHMTHMGMLNSLNMSNMSNIGRALCMGASARRGLVASQSPLIGLQQEIFVTVSDGSKAGALAAIGEVLRRGICFR